METNEIWKSVLGFEDYYEVSNFGRARSMDRIVPSSDTRKYHRKGSYKTISINTFGYSTVNLYKFGKLYIKKVHRLVAEAFIPNPNNYPQVNHKDGNKQNNHVDNLEWTTSRDNIMHALNNKLRRLPKTWVKGEKNHLNKPVIQLTMNGEFIKEFYSATQAHRETGIHQSKISAACMGKIRCAGNYQWKFNNLKTKKL